MSTINTTSPFTSYNLTPQELLQAQQLSLLQKYHIQNIIATYAIERINREIDPLNPIITAAADAKNKGAIEVLQYLLDLSESAEAAALTYRNLSTPQET